MVAHRLARLMPRLLPILFVALAGPACVILALSVPLGQVPDEPAHALRIDSVLHGEVIGRRVPAIDAAGRSFMDAGVIAYFTLLPASSALPDALQARRHMTAETWARLRNLRWDAARSYVSAPNTAVYPPVLYVPAAIGMLAAKSTGHGPFEALLAARLVNAVMFVALGALALAITRAGRVTLFVTLLLPMTLFLAGSLNQDGLLIALSALAAAFVTWFGAGRIWPLALGGVCISVMAAAKPAYLPLALVMLAPLEVRDLRARSLRRQAGAVAAVAMPALAWAGFAAARVAVSFPRPDYLPGHLWPGDPGRLFRSTDVAAQLLVLLHRPWLAGTLPTRAVISGWRDDLVQTIGVLGLLDVMLPFWLYDAWMTAGVAAIGADLLDGRRRDAAVRPLGALAVTVAVVASVFAIFILEYLNWTRVGAEAIDGVQGRYFLPLLPFVGVAVSAARLGDAPVARAIATCVPPVVAAVTIAVMVHLVVITYYLR